MPDEMKMLLMDASSITMKFWKYLIILSILSGCSQDVSDHGNLVEDTLPVNDSIVKAQKLKQDSDQFIDTMLYGVCARFEEPDLTDSGGSSYRFFFEDDITGTIAGLHIYRVYTEGARYYCVHKHFDKINNVYSDSLIVENREISEGEWSDVIRLINGSYFWSLESSHIGTVGLTDDLWVLEGRSASKRTSNQREHHLVHRFDPPEGSFKSACLKIREICEK